MHCKDPGAREDDPLRRTVLWRVLFHDLDIQQA